MTDDRLHVDIDAEDRSHRLRLIPWWDAELLGSSTALVLGAGAIGNEIIKNLALIGIGNIRIVDLDFVELSNLSRSVLFRASDEGRSKAEVAAEVANSINPDIRVTPIQADIVRDLPLGHYSDADVVLAGLDGREARLAGNAACIRCDTPYFDGAIQVIDGVARGFDGRNGPCYECTMNEHDWKLLSRRRSCNLLSREQMLEGHVPTTSTIASVIGGLLVQQAVLCLHGMDWQPGKAFLYNGLGFEAWSSMYTRREDCLAHDAADALAHWTDFDTNRTVRDTLERASNDLGSDVTIDLRTELVTARQCPACEFKDEPMLPSHKLGSGAGLCPGCEGELELAFVSSIDLSSPLAEASLNECGILDFDLIRVRSSTSSLDVIIGNWQPEHAAIS
ncbi:MAG: ThiF family adenylyltransferase [Phycisphaerales bacterium]|nr:ThiF family adenylyltransferase [Phycisphaerales bacterium]